MQSDKPYRSDVLLERSKMSMASRTGSPTGYRGLNMSRMLPRCVCVCVCVYVCVYVCVCV
jgi:hypothetical protein